MIPQDKILMVTGDPRTRTSLMMHMLDSLGVPIVGDRYPQERWRDDATPETQALIEQRIERAKLLNPTGYYEVPGIIIRGVISPTDLTTCGGAAVKVISNGAWPHQRPNGSTTGTRTEYVHKIILCVRNPKWVVRSQANLLSNVDIAGIDGWATPPDKPDDPSRYVFGTGAFAVWLAEQTQLHADVLTVDYSDWDTDTVGTLRRICTFLGVSKTDEELQAVAVDFDPELTRHVELEWSQSQLNEGQLCDDIYEMLRSGSYEVAPLIADQIASLQRDYLFNLAMWVDIDPEMDPEWDRIVAEAEDAAISNGTTVEEERLQRQRFFGTWVRVSTSHFMFLKANTREVRDKQLQLRQRTPMSCDCPHYTVSQNLQHVHVPLTLPDISLDPDLPSAKRLSLPLVNCQRDQCERTQLECRSCWFKGSVAGGEILGPQRCR